MPFPIQEVVGGGGFPPPPVDPLPDDDDFDPIRDAEADEILARLEQDNVPAQDNDAARHNILQHLYL